MCPLEKFLFLNHNYRNLKGKLKMMEAPASKQKRKSTTAGSEQQTSFIFSSVSAGYEITITNTLISTLLFCRNTWGFPRVIWAERVCCREMWMSPVVHRHVVETMHKSDIIHVSLGSIEGLIDYRSTIYISGFLCFTSAALCPFHLLRHRSVPSVATKSSCTSVISLIKGPACQSSLLCLSQKESYICESTLL